MDLVREVGEQMMDEGWNSRPASGGGWKTLPIGGFKSDLVSNGQLGDVHRHILYGAGSILSGSWARGFGFNAWDWTQSTYRSESETELRDNQAGFAVGRAMLSTANAGKNGNYAALFQAIFGILCDF
jgi:hypothetical protein